MKLLGCQQSQLAFWNRHEEHGWWTDAGTFESLLHASILVAKTGANKMRTPGEKCIVVSEPCPELRNSLWSVCLNVQSGIFVPQSKERPYCLQLMLNLSFRGQNRQSV